MRHYYLIVLATLGSFSDAEPTRHKRQSAVSPPQPGCPPLACPADCARQLYNDPQTGCQRCRCNPNFSGNPFFFGNQFGNQNPAQPSITGSTCTPGDKWTDKCNSCFCSPNGVPVCTLQDCTFAPPSPPCRAGDNWAQDCNRCTCVNNQPVCTLKACVAVSDQCTLPPDTPCTLAIERDCDGNQYNNGCELQEARCRNPQLKTPPCNNVERCVEGHSKRSDDGCNTCKCANGVYGCTRRLCPLQGRPVCNPNTPCPVDCPLGTIFTTDSQNGCQKCICRPSLGRPTPVGLCNPNPPCPVDCRPNGTTFVNNPQTGCRSCTCAASTGINIGGGPTPSIVCNPNPPCPADCATEFVLEPLTRCRFCRCQSGSPTIARPRPVGACPPIACPADCTTETIRNPATGCQFCRCSTSVTQINPFAPRLPSGFNAISFGNPFAG